MIRIAVEFEPIEYDMPGDFFSRTQKRRLEMIDKKIKEQAPGFSVYELTKIEEKDEPEKRQTLQNGKCPEQSERQ